MGKIFKKDKWNNYLSENNINDLLDKLLIKNIILIALLPSVTKERLERGLNNQYFDPLSSPFDLRILLSLDLDLQDFLTNE